MFTVRGTGRGSFIAGKSVHNQSVTGGGCWRQDPNAGGYQKTGQGRDAESWNCHPLRTEGNLTPNQLWMIGTLQASVPEPDLEQIQQGEEILPLDHDGEHGIVVPAIQCPLSEEGLAALQQINPNMESLSFGRDIYLQALNVATST
ncbi:uncharacterized protein LOC144007748 [Festucalex cinctus]